MGAVWEYLRANKGKLVLALVAALLAANGVLGLVDDSVVSKVLALLALLGLYVVPSPVQPKPPPSPFATPAWATAYEPGVRGIPGYGASDPPPAPGETYVRATHSRYDVNPPRASPPQLP